MSTHEPKSPAKDVALRAIAVLGLIAVLLLGAWGIIQLAVAVPSLLGGIGSRISGTFTPPAAQESITLAAASSVQSGQTLQVSWDHKNESGEYAYHLSYACQQGLSLKAPLPNGSHQNVECGKPFNFVNATERMSVIPSASKSTPLALTISATKLSTGAVTSTGNVTSTVTAAQTTAKPTTPSTGNSSTYVAGTVPQTLYGYGDLAVSINSVTPAGNGLSVMTFTITNIGTNSVAGGWMFNATLPVNGSYLYTSPPQRALFPGDKIVYKLTYGGAYGYQPYDYMGSYGGGYSYDAGGWSYSGPGYYGCGGFNPCYQQPQYGYSSGPVTIHVDPQNLVRETNEYNNTANTHGYLGY